MSSIEQNIPNQDLPATARSVWIKPQFARIEAGEAEASDGPGPDSGLAS